MTDYRKILMLRSMGCSQREIERNKIASRETSKAVFEIADRLGICWPLDDDITNADLERLLFPNKYKNACLYVEPDYQYIHRELAKPGVTLTLLWEEYRSKCYETGKTPYMSTQFGDKYRKWARVTKATMRIQHKPGDAIQVDWAGDTIPIYDSVTGQQSSAYLFVAVLPCSYYAYTEACADMKTENWLNCHVHAFNYFGGVTRLLIPDNCKTATSSNTRYDTVLNRSYQELADYYGTAIVPARVRRPKDKSSAEASVRFAETWIIAALRDRKFFSLQEVNEAVAEKLEELNGREFQQRTGTRRSAYLEEEQPYMLPLPATPFESAVWSVAKVPNDYLVSDGRNKYSVPYNLIGEKVDVRVTKNLVEVYYHGSRVASHRRLQTLQRDPLVKLEHMPETHQKYLTYNEDDFKVWAMSVGPMTEHVVDFFLESGKAPEQGYKACASLTKLGERYGKERLESACARVHAYGTTPSIRNISSILKSKQDVKAKTSTAQEQSSNTARYGITRGASYFANESILTKDFLSKIGLEGLVIGAMTMISFLTGYNQNGTLLGSTYAFGTLCLARLFHGYNCKSDHPVIFTKGLFHNKWLQGAFVLGAVLITTVLTVPGFHNLFKVETLNLMQLGCVYLYAFASLLIIQLLKCIRMKLRKRGER